VGRDIAKTRKAFTLIEVVAVLMIIGLLAGLGVMSLRGRHRAATMEALTAELCDFDGGARLYAERFGRNVRLRIDSGQVCLCAEDDENKPLRAPLVLPEGFAIKDCWMAGDRATDQTVEVVVGLSGRSSSYGFCIAGPNGKSRWIVISGLSGQREILESDEQSNAIMALLAQKRLPESARMAPGLHAS
jgi:prepilin-type N-terminal cleavage/methylation domain-containing protein